VGWSGEKPSQRIIEILFKRYKDDSDVAKFVEEIAGLDTLDKVGEWGSCERRVKMEKTENDTESVRG
jgi:hypothetical protein